VVLVFMIRGAFRNHNISLVETFPETDVDSIAVEPTVPVQNSLRPAVVVVHSPRI
jgi:hypothetical protein